MAKDPLETNIDVCVTEYEKLRPLYQEFTARLQHLVSELVTQTKKPFHGVECRTKTVESFKSKLLRPGKHYKNPISEITDLGGLRVILYYPEDVMTVCEMLKTEFSTDLSQSIDNAEFLAPDQLGYLSVHLIVKLNEERAKLREWSQFKDLTVEIQVKTVLQHAWASISHTLQYKHEVEVPKKFRRKLMRLAGLLELADEEFSELRSEQKKWSKEMASEIARDNLIIPLDAISVSKYLESSEIIEGIKLDINKAGLLPIPFTYDHSGAISTLISVCTALGFTSLDILDAELRMLKRRSFHFFKVFKKEQGECRGSLAHWVTVLLVGSKGQVLTGKKVKKLVQWGSEYITSALNAGALVSK